MCRYGRVAMVRGWLAAPCGDEGWSGEFAERQAHGNGSRLVSDQVCEELALEASPGALPRQAAARA